MQRLRLWPTILMMAVISVGCSSSQQSAPPPAAGTPSDPNALAPPMPETVSPAPGSENGGEPHASAGDLKDFDPVYFAFNSDQVDTGDRDKLHSVAEYLAEHSDAEITISGHCDDRGTPEYNLALGDRRAQAVKVYLKRLGAASNRINVVSYGAERPAIIGGGEEAWARNRRDEFHVIHAERAPHASNTMR
jgi:peptidoglycan-associated lipoprotein